MCVVQKSQRDTPGCVPFNVFVSFFCWFVCLLGAQKKTISYRIQWKEKEKNCDEKSPKGARGLLKNKKKNTDTRQRWHRQRQRCKEKKKQFSSFFPVTFFTSTLKCIERYTHKMLMVYGPCTYRVPFFSQFNLCPCMHGKGNKRQRQTESSKRIHFYM